MRPPWTASDTCRGLLRAVAAAPEDDLPRLVLADYLEEEGGPVWAPLGPYIRVQLANGSASKVLKRVQLREHASAWLAGFGRRPLSVVGRRVTIRAKPLSDGLIEVEWERGLPARVTVLTAQVLLRYREILVEWCPLAAYGFRVANASELDAAVLSEVEAHRQQMGYRSAANVSLTFPVTVNSSTR